MEVWLTMIVIIDSISHTIRAPTDCTQYFTGTAGSVQSYNFAGGQLLNSQYYTNCIRTEAGYCGIQWKESSTSSPDPFQMTKDPSTNGGAGHPSRGSILISYFITSLSQLLARLASSTSLTWVLMESPPCQCQTLPRSSTLQCVEELLLLMGRLFL